MKFLSTPEFKVGILVLIVGAVIAAMSFSVSEDPSYMGKARSHFFILNDATGLVKGSPVFVAGIRVGIIKDIVLDNGKARVIVTMENDAPLKESARVEIRAAGILGDKNIVIWPGLDKDPLLKNGAQLVNVKDNGSIDKLLGEVGKITESISKAAENIRAATEGDRSIALGRIIDNIEHLTGDLAELSKGNKEKVNDIIDQVHSITSSLDDVLNDDSPQGFKAAWSKVNRSLANVEQITQKINDGKGTIGRLVNDESTIEELNSAIANVNSFLGSANKIQLNLDFNSWYRSSDQNFKSFLGLKIQPGLDRFYLVQIVDDPRGVIERRQITTQTNGGGDTVVEEKQLFKNRIKLTALFGKNFYKFSIKGGVIENTGGFGVDYRMLADRLVFSTDAYDLSDFKARTYARYEFFKGLYVVGGVDDLFNDKVKKVNTFIGAGLFLTNDDIKALLGRINLR